MVFVMKIYKKYKHLILCFSKTESCLFYQYHECVECKNRNSPDIRL